MKKSKNYYCENEMNQKRKGELSKWVKKGQRNLDKFTKLDSSDQIPFIRDQYALDYTESSEESRGIKNNLFSRIQFKYSEDLSFKYYSDFNFKDKGNTQQILSEYRIMDGLLWTLSTEFYNGPDGSFYGRWYRNDRAVTSFKYTF